MSFYGDPSFSETLPVSGGPFTDSYENDLTALYGGNETYTPLHDDESPFSGDYVSSFTEFLTFSDDIRIEDPKPISSRRSSQQPSLFDDKSYDIFSGLGSDPSEIFFGCEDETDFVSVSDLLTQTFVNDTTTSGLVDDYPFTSVKMEQSCLDQPADTFEHVTTPPPFEHHIKKEHKPSASPSSPPIPSPSATPSPSSPSCPSTTKRQRTATAAITTTKMASRVFALQHLFAGSLPTFKPACLTDAQWSELTKAGHVVEVVECQSDYVTVRMNIAYDIIIHSLANYGQALKEWTESPATRFRWWSDFVFATIKVGNKNANKSLIDRTVNLPPQMIAHPYIQNAWKRRDNATLLKEFSAFFARLLKNYLHPDDHQAYEDGGFGRTRKRPRCNDSTSSALDSTLTATILSFDRSFKGLNL